MTRKEKSRHTMTERMKFDRMLEPGVAHYYLPSEIKETDMELIREEPLAINIQGKNHATVMRTPGDERAHAAGFCLAEGIIDHPDDIRDIALCDGEDSNVAAVMLTPSRLERVQTILEGKSYMSQTSCGICGREIIDDLGEILTAPGKKVQISFGEAMAAVSELKTVQKLRKRCFASHAVAIFNPDLKMISSAEDAGRHNALDKAVGRLFLEARLSEAAVTVLSSRASYEMIQKSARAGMEVVISMSRPTALALDLAKRLGMTLTSVRDDGLYVYTGKERITWKKQ